MGDLINLKNFISFFARKMRRHVVEEGVQRDPARMAEAMVYTQRRIDISFPKNFVRIHNFPRS